MKINRLIFDLHGTIPPVTIRIAFEDPRLDRLAIVYPGDRRYALDERVEVVPLAALATPGRLLDPEPQ